MLKLKSLAFEYFHIKILLQRRLRWFGHASRRAPDMIIREVICLTPLPTWRKRRGGQLKTWSTIVQEDLGSMAYDDGTGSGQ